MSKELSGKIAVVTGGGSGIGRATANAFGAAGACVMESDLDGSSATSVAAEIRANGGEADAVAADVSSEPEGSALMDAIVSRFGGLDVAFNNAGISTPPTPLHKMSVDDLDRTIAVNMKGVWLSLRGELRLMMERGGSFINMASAMGLIGRPLSSAFTATRHGVVGLSKAAALEYGRYGVRVISVCPGVMRTPLSKKRLLADPFKEAAAIAMLPNGRIGSSDEVAAAVVWLAVDEASIVSGAAIAIDGGWTV